MQPLTTGSSTFIFFLVDISSSHSLAFNFWRSFCFSRSPPSYRVTRVIKYSNCWYLVLTLDQRWNAKAVEQTIIFKNIGVHVLSVQSWTQWLVNDLLNVILHIAIKKVSTSWVWRGEGQRLYVCAFQIYLLIQCSLIIWKVAMRNKKAIVVLIIILACFFLVFLW